MKKIIISFFGSAILFASCQNDQGNAPVKDSANQKTSTSKPVTVEEITVKEQVFMVMKDTAASEQEVGAKLGVIYDKIMACSKKCGMEMTGAPTAWYSSNKAPFIFEAGAPFSAACSKPEKGIYSKKLAAGKALVGHYFGAYEKIQSGYDAVMQYAIDKKIKLGTDAWEVYVTDPMNEKDTAKWQTDIYFPIK